MEFKTTVIAGAALLAIMISGCAGTPELDENWGRSYEEAKVNPNHEPGWVLQSRTGGRTYKALSWKRF